MDLIMKDSSRNSEDFVRDGCKSGTQEGEKGISFIEFSYGIEGFLVVESVDD